ncbi:hypothetical protein [Commensalibacter oyaizuii]|uniref:Uncharacterized protein n=1 Tax=Commensalibacter oyaizuii TaxID=3043873 RepID=A0ABT6Q3E0_9PROT|nr:hypothetical protein [Commensalibacter sp. TBRC 16381]MDI2091620.1 hypothetical protein [Commensalibacter sp. TBRC 16381]
MQKSTTIYRAILRDQLANLLDKTKLVEEGRVFRNFSIKVPQEKLPCFFVSAPHDQMEPLTTATPVFMRTATLVIQYFCNFVNIDDATKQLDQVCYAVEQIIMCDYDFQYAFEQMPSFTTETVFNPDTGKQIAEIRFVITCKYREDFFPEGPVVDRITGQIT